MKKAAALVARSVTPIACLADGLPQFANGYYQGTLYFSGNSVSVTEPMTSNGYGQGRLDRTGPADLCAACQSGSVSLVAAAVFIQRSVRRALSQKRLTG